mmetsp:Transcript_33103/g.105497  ORF Transcript_33103/g.105497 Transcript_33103/m.105497 type:complete len:368 (+) Transcript_33103:1-1104(+)
MSAAMTNANAIVARGGAVPSTSPRAAAATPAAATPLRLTGLATSAFAGKPVISRASSAPLRAGRAAAHVCFAAEKAAAASAAETGAAPTDVGRPTYRPATFAEMVQDSVNACTKAMAKGMTRMEIEFPPLPNSVSSYEGRSDDYIDCNLQYAIQAGKLINKAEGKTIHIVVPDAVELRRASKKFKSALEFAEGITFGSLSEVTGASGDDTLFALKSIFTGETEIDSSEDAAKADMYIVVNCSTIELPAVRTYCEEVVGSKPIVLFNLELETLRADLGMFGFPPKDVHFNWLSGFTPVFYLRQRDYSKSVAVAPFILNYSGAIFREFRMPPPRSLIFLSILSSSSTTPGPSSASSVCPSPFPYLGDSL